MIDLPPIQIPVVDKEGKMDPRWYRYFFQVALAKQPKEFKEITNPDAPDPKTGLLYVRDNAGKVELVIRFPTGAIQTLAIEP